MSAQPDGECRYFLSYSGVKLPLALITPIDAAAIRNRNTYFRAWYEGERLLGFDKLVYGEVEMSHRYTYRADGSLLRADVTDADGETTQLYCDAQGQPGIS